MNAIFKIPSKIWNLIIHHKIISVVVIVIAIIAALFFYQKSKPTPEEFSLVTPQSRDIKQTLDLSGKINASEQATLRFQAGGKLAYVCCKKGDTIEKFHTVASLDKSALKKQLEKQLNSYLVSRWSFEENRDQANINDFNLNLFSLSDTLKRSLETDQFNLNKAVIDVELQDITNQLATIYSPISGVLVDAAHELPGVTVTAADSWLVVNPESLYFEAEVDEVDVGSISVGQQAEINLDAFPDKVIKSTLSHIDFASSPGSSGGTVFKVKFQINTTELNYRLGFNGDVQIILAEKKDILTIPVDALIERDDQVSVKVVVDKVQEDRPVKIGIRNEEYVEIISGLQTNDQVVLPKSN